MRPVPTQELEQTVREAGLIAILRGDFTYDQLRTIAGALLEGGVRVLELTLNTTDALAGIARLNRELGQDALVGAGTVRTARDVDAALDAGARFLVSPNFDALSVQRSQARGALHFPVC